MNTTLKAVELNYTNGIVAQYENFTLYTETDPQNKMTVYDYNITWSVYERDDGGRVVCDYGVGSINDGFEYTFEMELTALDSGDADSRNFQNIIVFSQTDQAPRSNNEIQIILRQRTNDDTIYGVNFYQYDGAGNEFESGTVDYNVSQLYYFLVNRTGTSKDLISFYDENRTQVIEKMNIGIGNDDYRYISASKIASSAVDGSDDSSGYIRDLFNTSNALSGYYPNGYFTTVNYMNDLNANGSSLALMTISQIPTNTQIEVEFSNDNSSWTGTQTLTDGFNCFDMRTLNYTNTYFKYTLSTTDFDITPRLNQSRLITTQGNSTGGGTPIITTEYIYIESRPLFPFWFIAILLILLVLIVIGTVI